MQGFDEDDRGKEGAGLTGILRTIVFLPEALGSLVKTSQLDGVDGVEL